MSSLKDTGALLQEIGIFASMEPTRLKLIAYVASSVRFRAGDSVLAAGQVADAVLIVESGTLERHDARMERGAVIGPVGILSSTPERYETVAATDATALRIARAKFEELLEKFPELRAALLRDFALRLARGDG